MRFRTDPRLPRPFLRIIDGSPAHTRALPIHSNRCPPTLHQPADHFRPLNRQRLAGPGTTCARNEANPSCSIEVSSVRGPTPRRSSAALRPSSGNSGARRGNMSPFVAPCPSKSSVHPSSQALVWPARSRRSSATICRGIARIGEAHRPYTIAAHSRRSATRTKTWNLSLAYALRQLCARHVRKGELHHDD